MRTTTKRVHVALASLVLTWFALSQIAEAVVQPPTEAIPGATRRRARASC